MTFSNYYFREEAGKPVVLFPGRFQPFSVKHAQIYDIMKKENPEMDIIIYIIKGEKTSLDKDRNPFDFEYQKDLIQKVTDCDMIRQLPDAFIGNLVSDARSIGCEPKHIYAGSDRKKGYERQLDKYKEELGTDMDVKEILRIPSGSVSSSQIRTALKQDDYKTFEKLTTGYTEEDYNIMKKKIVKDLTDE